MTITIICGFCGQYRPRCARGLCGSCYAAAYKAGTLPPLKRPTLDDRIVEAQVGRSEDECWPWPGNINHYGYGRYGQRYAHREVYLRRVGPVPDEHEVEHNCHTRDPDCYGGKSCPHRRCINYLRHLEPLPGLLNWERGRSLSAENRRKTACDKGHDYTPENLYEGMVNGKLVRRCRTCTLASNRKSDQRRIGRR